jgi:hypothetical protein
MEQLQRRSSYVNFFHPVNSNNNNNNNRKPTMAKLKPLTDKDWTQELETFCGHKLDKVRFIFSLPFFFETHRIAKKKKIISKTYRPRVGLNHQPFG